MFSINACLTSFKDGALPNKGDTGCARAEVVRKQGSQKKETWGVKD